MISLKRIVSFCVLVTLVMPYSAMAIPKSSFVNPISETSWQEIFPIKMSGVTLMSGSGYDTPDIAVVPICFCPFPPPIFYRRGMPISFWEPARTVSATKDPFFFPELGFSIEVTFLQGDLSGTSQSAEEEVSAHSFFQSHWMTYPVWSLMGMLADMGCVEGGGMDMSYMTELDLLWQEDALSMFIHPEVLLFSNPIAQLACIADSVSVNLWRPLDALFWCQGSSGSAYPMTGRMPDESMIQSSFGVATKMTYKLSRSLLLMDKAINWCVPMMAPIWIKPHFKYQQQRPVVKMAAQPVGKSSWIWQHGANPPTGSGVGASDNFSWLVFQKRVCCYM